MFTIEQIKQAHSQVKSGADFPTYIQAIKALGVSGYEAFVENGHVDYFGATGFKISSPSRYEALAISSSSDKKTFIEQLKAHQQGKTDYPTFCKMCADTGVEKWIVRMEAMTCTYYDRTGNEVLEEKIPV